MLARKAPGGQLAEEVLANEVPHPQMPTSATPEVASEGSAKMLPTIEANLSKPSGLSAMADTPEGMASSMPKGTGSVTSAGTSAVEEIPASENEMKARFLTQVLGGSARQLRNLPGKNMVQTLNKMGDTINENNLISMTDRFSDRMAKFQQAHDSAGRVIGATIEKAQVPAIPAAPIAEQIAKVVKFPNPQQLAQIQGLEKQIGAYADESGNLTFQRLQQLKSDLGDQAFKGQGDPVLQQAYHVVSNIQDHQLESVAGMEGVNKPVFDKAKELYQVTSRALPMLKMATARSIVNKPSLGELLSGHPIEAATKALGEPLTRATNAIGFKATSALEGVPSAVSSSAAPSSLAAIPKEYHQVFHQAIQGLQDPAEIQKQMSVTDFVLQSSNPAYAAAKNNMGK
jgi:hypothetical protein